LTNDRYFALEKRCKKLHQTIEEKGQVRDFWGVKESATSEGSF
jgi:hypothetical protein